LAEAPSNPAPRLRLPRPLEIVLVLSLCLNFFVAGGIAYSRWIAPPPHEAGPPGPERRLDAIARRLGLDPDEVKPFRELKRSYRSAQGVLGAQNRPLAEEIWEELAKPQPEAARLEDLLDRMAANRRAFQGATTEALTRFLAAVTPEQRASFIKLMEDRTDPVGGPLRNNIGN